MNSTAFFEVNAYIPMRHDVGCAVRTLVAYVMTMEGARGSGHQHSLLFQIPHPPGTLHTSVEVVPLTYPLHERVGIPYVPLTATPY